MLCICDDDERRKGEMITHFSLKKKTLKRSSHQIAFVRNKQNKYVGRYTKRAHTLGKKELFKHKGFIGNGKRDEFLSKSFSLVQTNKSRLLDDACYFYQQTY